MTDFLKIAKSIAFHFAHICAYGVETVKELQKEHSEQLYCELSHAITMLMIFVCVWHFLWFVQEFLGYCSTKWVRKFDQTVFSSRW